jgi:hypothetical protein
MKTIRLTPGELEELIQFLEDPDEPLCTCDRCMASLHALEQRNLVTCWSKGDELHVALTPLGQLAVECHGSA